jgi:poly(3-hydroxybutyrate) depolymerase
MTIRAAVAAAAAAAVLGAASGTDDFVASLKAAGNAYRAQIVAIAPIVGRDCAVDYWQRLSDDAELLDDGGPQPGDDPADGRAYARATATLDYSLVTQLLDRRFAPMAAIRGLGETFVRSSKDGTMQPVAVYVPSSYVRGHPVSLVVFLHGHPQSESSLLAAPYVAALAERTTTIVVAPYGRGYYDFRGSVSDVYDAVSAATTAFTIDPRKRYLAGYSMGGFSVYEVAPVHAADWSAVMSIAGALLGSDSRRVVSTMQNTPFYVLTGSADDSIPTKYPTQTAAFLQGSGLAVSFYSQPGGVHRLITLLPILSQAWDDMLRGIVRSPPPVADRFTLPSAPADAMKP